MLRALRPLELLEWQVFEGLEPFEPERGDYRMASVCQALWNIARDTKRHPRPFPIKDFLVLFGDAGQPTRRQTWQEQKRLLTMYAQAYGRKAKKQRARKPKAKA